MWAIISTLIFIYPFLGLFGSDTINLIFNSIFLFFGLLYILLHRQRLKRDTSDLFLILFFLNLAISAFLFSEFPENIINIYKYLPLILIFYIASISDNVHEKKLINLLLLSGFLVSLYSLRSFFIVSKYIPHYMALKKIYYPFAKEFLSRNRAFVPFISPNLLAGYIAMLLFISAGKLWQNKKDNLPVSSNILPVSCLIIYFLTFFLTKSIGAWTSLILATACLMLVMKKINRKTLIILLLLLALLAIGVSLRFKGLTEISKPSFSLSQRTLYWADTIDLIKKYPLTGCGLGNFSLKASRYAHNSYLQIWAETGLAGLLLWLGIICIFLKRNIQVIKISKNKFYYAGILGAGISFLTHNFIDFSFFIAETSFLWWAILGLIIKKTPEDSLYK